MMKEFPEFMRNERNEIDIGNQNNGYQGYVFDGADGSQMLFWTYTTDGALPEHTHEYDEYVVAVEGQFDVDLGGKTNQLLPGQEILIPKGELHSAKYIAGTRTIHVFGGYRVKRKLSSL